MGRRTKARECALQMLYQWERSGESVERVAESFWRVRTTTDETRAMAERLFTGTVDHQKAIDDTIVAPSPTGASTAWPTWTRRSCASGPTS